MQAVGILNYRIDGAMAHVVEPRLLNGVRKHTQQHWLVRPSYDGHAGNHS